MKAIIPIFKENTNVPIYLQLYEYIKEAILSGETVPNEKLPSLRNLSSSLGISITTVNSAYAQLEVEGYIYSKPQRGYFISEILSPDKDSRIIADPGINFTAHFVEKSTGDFTPISELPAIAESSLIYDTYCFDFHSWKRCMDKVLTDYTHLLMTESNPQGEEILRHEIAKYVYSSRGVKCIPEQIVIAAGTQQITNHLSNILRLLDISLIAVEDPGYKQVRNIFRDRRFNLSYISVLKDGINIDALPSNVRSAVYVNPSNQFPTGAVMPVGNRYKLLKWAKENDSYIVEDDYDSELRYFGRPVPSLQGLDQDERVIYLGSFSSTLFPSAKISYMVLPFKMAKLFQSIMKDYSQSCSKTEQLALAFFMESGRYQTGIKKLRRLYSRKLTAAIEAFEKYAGENISPENTTSGINMLLSVKSKKSPEILSSEALKLGLSAVSAGLDEKSENVSTMIFYYNRIPIEMMDSSIKKLCSLWLNN